MDYPVTQGTGLDREDRSYFRGMDDMLPDVKFLLPRCDAEITMRKTLAEVAQLFCRETGVFVETAEITLVNDVVRYLLPIGFPADIEVVQGVTLKTVQDGKETIRSMFSISYDIEDEPDEDDNYIKLGTPLNFPTGVVASLLVKMSLIPYFDQMLGTEAYALPDKFLRRWRAAFVAGAVAQLAAMDGRPWTNKQLALDMRARYTSLHGEAVSKAQITLMKTGGATCVNPIGFV